MYHLKVESGPRAGERIPLPSGGAAPLELTIGRGVGVNVRFPDTTMSREQALLRWDGQSWSLVNSSRHGSFVGRRRVAPGASRRLGAGDRLLLGETQLVFGQDLSVATPGADPLTPATPSIAAPPSRAGYDPDGRFHSGQTLFASPEAENSFIYLGGEPGAGMRIKKRQVYFFALVALLGLFGCLATGGLIVVPTLEHRPGTLLLATLFALLPAVPYAIFIKSLDRNDQIPWRNFLACVVWGGTVGCGFALVLNTLGTRTLAAYMAPADAWSLTAILIAPLVEEVVKGMAVLVVFWILHDEFDNMLEGLVLGAASGLGFALVENCIYNVHFLSGGFGTLLVMGFYRMVVNALIGHPIYTAMTGAGLGLMREVPRQRRWRYLLPLIGLATAIAMHVVWNAAAVTLGRALGDAVGFMTLALNAAVFGGAGLLFFLAAYVFAARRERRVLVTYLAEETAKEFIEEEELESFDRPLGRLRYELGGLLRFGPRVYLERKALRRAQVELAFRKWHLAKGDAPRGVGVDRYVREARDRIRDARNALNELEGRPRGSGRYPAVGE